MTWPVYAQRNVPGLPAVPWNGQRLGTCNGITLGTDGCYVTSMAQVARRFEHPITPAQLDDIMTNRRLYVQGCLMVDANLSKVFPDIAYVETRSWFNVPAQLGYLVMADNEEIIIGLDNRNTGNTARHFARVFDYNPKTGVLLIDDPWWGRTLNFASVYGSPLRNVVKAAKYRRPGWVPPEKRIVVPPAPPPPLPTFLEWIAANVHRPDLANQGARIDLQYAVDLIGQYRKEVHR